MIDTATVLWIVVAVAAGRMLWDLLRLLLVAAAAAVAARRHRRHRDDRLADLAARIRTRRTT